MRGNLEQALENTETTYQQLVEIANEIVDDYTKEINALIKSATARSENMSNDDIRQFILQLALKSYTFSEVKEKSVLKAECAEALRKEAYAKAFNALDGSNAVRENNAMVEISDEVLTEAIYNLVASLLKVKLDEIHRVVDALKTILMSRMQEAKLSAGIDGKVFE